MNEREIFIKALQREEGADRSAFLDEACGQDTELRQQVERLITEHQRDDSFFLDSPPPGMDATSEQPISEGPGTVIGPYKLLQRIGEGGFGVVYMADQTEPVKRRVALKIIKPGMDSRQVISRFEVERQALALMDHPNIARVLDAGTTDSGRPYFVMDLVRGVPITQYCDEHQLTPRERLELFVPVCHAVQHAHQKGIIHRDIKPTNVLVGEYDERAVPRIIDFGVAKALRQETTEKSLFTQFGQIVGTVDYMSPEQAKLNELDVDTRSDVYSLGVLLYELLTGHTPIDRRQLEGAAFDELLRIIREVEPPKPSTRLSTLGDTAGAISADRNTEPKKLGHLLRGDLDWIVMKALEKDRIRRYETANGFASDIKRYLDDEPVQARPPSAVYRFRKFARRHRAMMTTVGLVAASLVLGVMVSGSMAIRANTAQRVAKQEEQRAVAAEQSANRERNAARDAERRAQVQRDETRRLLYPADLVVAQRAWDAGDVAGAMNILDRHIPQENEEDLRGFHWDSLRRLCDRSLMRQPIQYRERITSVALSPDGKMVAAASSIYAQQVHVYDVASGDRLDPGLEGLAVACSANDATFSILNSSGISFWDPETGISEETLSYSGGAVLALAASSDGSRMATGGFDKKVHVWNLDKNGSPRVFAGPESVTFSVALSPDGRWVAAAAHPKLFLWEVEGGEEPVVLKHDVDNATCVAFAHDGTTLVSGGLDGRILLWDIETKRPKKVLSARNGAQIYSLACSSNGMLAAGAEDGSVTVWRLEDGEQIDVLKGHQHMVWSVTFSKDNRTLASGSMDGEVRTWDVAHRRPPDEWKHPTQQFTSVAFSPDGSVVATASTDHVATLWDAQTGEQLATLPAHRGWINEVAFSPSGQWLAAVSPFDETIRVWDLALGTDRDLLKQFLPLAVAFSPDGKKLAVGGAGPQLHLWDFATATPAIECKGHERQINSLVFSPDGKIMASAGWDSKIMLWDASTGDRVGTLIGHDQDVRCLMFSPDGKTLASCAADGRVKLWDVGDQKERETLAGHTATVFSIAYSPDGQILASGGGDNTVKLWYPGTNREPESLPTDAPALSVAFSPSGETLACANGDAVRFWRTVDMDGSDQLDRRWDLQRQARAIMEAEPQHQRRILADLRDHLAAAAVKDLTLRDTILASATAWRLVNGGQAELAEETFRSLSQTLATSGKPQVRRFADGWEAKLWEHRARLRVEAGKVEQAIPLFTKSLDFKPDSWRTRRARARAYATLGNWEKAASDLTAARAGNPDLRVDRGQLYVRLGQWQKASVDYGQSVVSESSDEATWLLAASLLALADDLAGYQHHCRAMLARFGQREELHVVERTSRACLLLPDAVDGVESLLNTLEGALGNGTAPGWMTKWGYLSLALAAHREGDPDKALKFIYEAQRSPGYEDAGAEKAIALCLTAMSRHRLGETDKARQASAKASSLTEGYFSRLATGERSVEHDWLIAEVLRREATKLTAELAEPPTSDANTTLKLQETRRRKRLGDSFY